MRATDKARQGRLDRALTRDMHETHRATDKNTRDRESRHGSEGDSARSCPTGMHDRAHPWSRNRLMLPASDDKA